MSWPTPTQAPTPVPQRARTSRGIDALLGILAAAFGLTVGMLVAALIGGAQFAPLDVVASSVIDVPPAPVKSWATSTFGTSAKTFVVVTTLQIGRAHV